MGWIWGDQERSLTDREEALIRRVFRFAAIPPLSKIRIRNGLSTTGVPFTTLGSPGLKVISGFPFRSNGEYLLMVGPRLFAGDLALMDPTTLVHEMTHVWQYKNETLTEFQGLATHVLYYLRGKFGGRNNTHLYKYKIGEPWNDMGFEGQAQLVQDWYSIDGMSDACDRWYYVNNVLLLGDVEARNRPLELLK